MAWETKRIKDIFSFSKGLSITKENLIEKGVPVISYGQIHSKQNKGVRIDDSLIRYVSENYLKTGDNSLTKKHDFIFADTSEDLEGCGNNVHVDRDMPLFAGYHTLLLRNKKPQDCRYFAYQFNSDEWRTQIRKSVFGVKVYSITQKSLSSISLTIPPLNTQQKISDYLDCKTQNIDKKIELLQKKKEKYITLRKTIINEAVNIDGKNWKRLRVKDLFSIYNGNGFDVQFQGNTIGDYPFCKASDINGNEKYVSSAANYVNEDLVTSEKYNIIPKNSIIFSKIGEALKKNHRKINNVPCIIDNNCAALVSKEKINIEFYYYVFYMLNMCKFDNGGPIPSVNSSQLLASSIVHPDIQIQNNIADYLDIKTNSIDKIIEKITIEIDTLKTYRRAIINEAVTGKLNIE